MADEESKQEKEVSENSGEEQKTEQGGSTPEAVPAVDGKKKKIAKMNMDEIEKQLANVKSKMGGLGSGYARQLLKRKETLMSTPQE